MSGMIPHLVNQLTHGALTHQIAPDLVNQVHQTKLSSAFYNHAHNHGLGALVYHALDHFDLLEHISSKTEQKLKHTYYRTLSNNLCSLQALKNLRQHLPASTPLLILKGPTLIERIYPNPALRPMTDIDILIRPEHKPLLKDCLQSLDYTSPAQYPDIFFKDNVIFDIHTDPFHADRIQQRAQAVPLNLDQLWQNAIPFRDSPTLFMPSLPNQILTLSVHALKHGYERKIWLFDILYSIHLAIQTHAWLDIESHCKKYGALQILAHSLHAIQIHLASALPHPAQNLQKSFPIGPIMRKIIRISPQSGDFQILEPLVLSQQFSKTKDRLHFLWAFAFPKRKALKQISGLSGSLTWLSYPYRMIQLVSLGTLQLAKLIYRLIGTRSS